MEWIKKIAPIVGYGIGLVLVAIGAVMSLQAGMKLAFADPMPYYGYDRVCESDFKFSQIESEETQVKMTAEEKDACEAEQEEREERQFKNRHIQSLIDGFSLLIVGGIFWRVFRERGNKSV
jgi:hypothetical protein